jgi:transposase-like protein
MGEMRRRFTKEYKIEAVRLATVGDKSLAQVARELGLRPMCCESESGSSRRRPAPRRRFRATVGWQEQRRSCSGCVARWSS